MPPPTPTECNQLAVGIGLDINELTLDTIRSNNFKLNFYLAGAHLGGRFARCDLRGALGEEIERRGLQVRILSVSLSGANQASQVVESLFNFGNNFKSYFD